MRALKRTFLATTALASAVAIYCLGIVALNAYGASKRGIYWECLEEANVGEGSGSVSWIVSFLPHGYTCTLNGEPLGFHDLGTSFFVVGLWAIAAILFSALAFLVLAVATRRRPRA